MPWPDKFYWVKRNIRNDRELDIDKFLEDIDKGQPPSTAKEQRELLKKHTPPPPAAEPKSQEQKKQKKSWSKWWKEL